jgi:hypothetical protein
MLILQLWMLIHQSLPTYLWEQGTLGASVDVAASNVPAITKRIATPE